MAVVRVSKTADYTVMSNVHFREKEMSLRAKGLLSFMLSLPDEWDYSVAGLCSLCIEKEQAIISTLAELKKFGYLTVEKKMPNETESGRIEYVYTVYEKPQKQGGAKQGLVQQGVVTQGLVKQGVVSPTLDNNNKSNTNILNTNNINTNGVSNASASTPTHRFVKPTVEEISAYCAERKNDVDAQRFFDFYEAKGWRIGNNPMKNWKAAVRTWERRDNGGGNGANKENDTLTSKKSKYAGLNLGVFI